jgi:hypothetical protein
MAEFNLGRIKFVWKSTWATSTTYVKDDVVRYGGKTYICVVGHTSDADFYTDLNNIPTRWNQMTDGQEWKGSWATSTFYKINDIVKYGGYIYVCNTSHTSAATTSLGLEDNQSDWDLFAETFDWKTNWATSTRYKVNDIVKYGGITYICNEYHTSAATSTLGLENDQAKWDFLHKGIDYLGSWSGSSVRYKINDVVKYGAGLWICTTYHTSSATFAEVNWSQFVEGLEFDDSWNSSAIYQPGDTVAYGGYVYISKTNNTNQTPTTNSDDWDLYVTGFKFQGAWGVPNFYEVGSVVRYGAYVYLAIADHEASFSNNPPDTNYWALLNSGQRWVGPWALNTSYVLGDIAKFGPSSYVCVLAHTASVPNRPDNDVSGNYWNIFTAGSELAVLTTQGDIAYYGGAGPARLPIGDEGMVLKVNATDEPTWNYFGVINQIFYVAPSGEDNPNPLNGVTIDRPWKTVQYALQRIERGPLNPDARWLLEINRQFIQKEVTAWIAAQIAGPIAPFTGSFTYDSAKCERDIGLIIDALAFDLAHGGNSAIRRVAISYGSEAGAFYLLGQKEETIASINYANTVIDAVLSNVAPATVYQGTVTQVIDTNYTEESGAQSILNNLVTALTVAINAVDDSSTVFAETKTNYTLNVKTGTFTEVLPFVVPKDTAVVGDELRSTRIEPASSIISAGDVTYSLAALQRLSSIISDIVQNIAIVKSTGNPLNQTTSRPAGSATEGTAVSNLFTAAKNYINFYINASGTAPALTGTNYWSTNENVYNAVNVLEINKEFLAEEAVAYINVTYPLYASTYDEAACKRDVREYIDAIKWDIVYNSNYRTLTAANLYVNAVNGSQLIDMFYLRSGTGVRNCTLAGLTGTLGAANAYGTQRPTAGAYTSLDPGWGPDDERVWITERSPYVQNVTTFGTACVGLKVDGDLHNGGNDSIVANDYTQVLSDGIGAWVTNLGRAELVSVFSYYAHIAYLAEDGGKIRATNGNNSYGKFGSVAEGVDVTETPIQGLINNKSVEAQIGLAFTDGTNNVLRLEYTNAGIDYTSATYTISGSGLNAAALADEFRDDAVYEVRLTDPGDSSGIGGSEYIYVSNAAQSGSIGQITIANTDTALSSTYSGMRIVLNAGSGCGQSAAILNYNSGTKVALIYKENFTILTVTATTTGTDLITVASTGTLYADMPIYLGSNVGGLSANTLYYVISTGFTATEFSVSTSVGGAAVALTTTTSQSVPLYAAGWDHIAPGTAVTNNLDVTTSYQIEPRLTFTSPGFSATARTITSGYYNYTAYGNIINTYTGVSATGGSGSSALFSVVRNGSSYTVTNTTPGTGYQVDDVLTIAGTSVGGTSPTNDITISVTKVVTGGINAFDTSGFGAGGLFVTGDNYSANTYYSSNGTSWSAGGALPGGFTGVGAVGYGDGTWIAIESATSNDRTAISTDGGQTWTAGGALPVSEYWVDVHYGNGRWIAINSSTSSAYSIDDGVSWTAMTGLPSSSWRQVTYGKGIWVAIGSNAVVSSTNGTTWTTRTLPVTATNWNSVTYGNNMFIAVAEDTAGTNVYAYSINGTTWSAGKLPATVYWNAVAYGQGLFLATSGSSSAVAATSEDGINWTSRTMPAAIGYRGLAFGNPNRSGIWVGFKSSATGTEAFSLITGTTTKARAVVNDEKITSIRIIEPGSGYVSAPTMTIIDPNNTSEASTQVRKGKGVLANPTFTNRGTNYVTASATVTGNGYADLYQTGTYIAFKRLTGIPKAGSNVRITGINDVVYKLVNVSQLTQQGDYYSAVLQLSPGLGVAESPDHEETTEIRIRYSQVRLTGHDFLDIGTGNFTNTNYPNTPLIDPDPTKEINEFGGGRVFYTSTDQDGNFRVGDIFSVEQSTGIATLNADAFSIAGLQELQLGSVALGGGGAAISEFSTDPFFTADSDSIVPTQRAIKAYISAQIGSGASSLNVNSVTAGIIYIAGDTITTTTGAQININTKMNFKSGVDGYILAHTLFN